MVSTGIMTVHATDESDPVKSFRNLGSPPHKFLLVRVIGYFLFATGVSGLILEPGPQGTPGGAAVSESNKQSNEQLV